MKKRFSETQIIGFLREADAGVAVQELCRRQLRQDGRVVNHKRIERLYAEAQLQVRCRTRKKVPVGERQPLVRP